MRVRLNLVLALENAEIGRQLPLALTQAYGREAGAVHLNRRKLDEVQGKELEITGDKTLFIFL